MCGICGLYGFSQKETPLALMKQALMHRGPDSDGFYGDGKIALGIRRLAIIDLKTGEQPIYNEDGSIVVISNGEIYNYQDLTFDLTKKGHRFVTQSDTEAIVHSYEEYGVDCVHYLRGMFAFAIWDSRAGMLFLARDRLGIKPLYFWQNGARLAFASEVRALLASGLVPRRLSLFGLASYLAYGAVQEPLTLIEGVYSLLPGHTLTLQGGEVKIQCYWDLPAVGKVTNKGNLLEIQAQIRKLLMNSVATHLLSEVPLGVFLSSGMDSGAIVGLASQVTNETVRSFTISFAEQEYDESQLAEMTAKRWGTQHMCLQITQDEVLRDLPQALADMDQPTVDGINTWYVARSTKRAGITVALSGLGGDELFGGYPTFRQIPLMKQVDDILRGMPLPLRHVSRALARVLLPTSDQGYKLDAFMRGDTYFAHPYYAHRVLFTPAQQRELLSMECSDRMATDIVWQEKVAADLTRAADYDIISSISYLELRNYMLCTLLRDADSMSMSHSLEVRVPFLDHKLVEYVISLPGYLKVGRNGAKPLLAGALKDILPPEVAWRKKRTFTFPWNIWLRNSLRTEVEQVLLNHSVALRGVINRDGVYAIWRRFLANQTSWARPWALFVLKHWVAMYLD